MDSFLGVRKLVKIGKLSSKLTRNVLIGNLGIMNSATVIKLKRSLYRDVFQIS